MGRRGVGVEGLLIRIGLVLSRRWLLIVWEYGEKTQIEVYGTMQCR